MNPWATRLRTPVRRHGAESYLLATLLSFAASLSLTRLFLNLSGFPQLGNQQIHIAHVLWGGLLLFIAALLPLIYANRGFYWATGVLAGVGIGLFIDEVGKFITQTNDYFYPPAAPIIYAFFLLTVLLYYQVRRKPTRAARECRSTGEVARAGAPGRDPPPVHPDRRPPHGARPSRVSRALDGALESDRKAMAGPAPVEGVPDHEPGDARGCGHAPSRSAPRGRLHPGRPGEDDRRAVGGRPDLERGRPGLVLREDGLRRRSGDPDSRRKFVASPWAREAGRGTRDPGAAPLTHRGELAGLLLRPVLDHCRGRRTAGGSARPIPLPAPSPPALKGRVHGALAMVARLSREPLNERTRTRARIPRTRLPR